MRQLRTWLVRLAGLFDKGRRDRELAEELESHLQMHTEDNLRAGMEPEEARRVALIKLGGLESTKEACRDQGGVPWVQTTIQDLRYATRVLGAKPVFTLVIVATLALGIGVNTAIFSLINAVMFRPPPYPDPDRLVQVTIAREDPSYEEILRTPEVLAWQRENQVFSHLGFFHDQEWNMTGGDEPVRVQCGDVSEGFLPALGVQPALGRVFTKEEDQPGGPAVAILSHGLWRRRFGGNTNVVGRKITIDERTYTVVGVLPSSFEAPQKYIHYDRPWEVLRPLQLGKEGHGYLLGLGRLKLGVSLEQATAWTERVYQPFRDPEEKGRVVLARFQDYRAHGARFTLLLYQGAVGFVLLIACANAGNLLLARGLQRQREIAVRVALGAGRKRIIRQLITESLLLAFLGAAAGLLLAWGAKDAVRATLPLLRGVSSVGLDARVLVFTFLTALLVTLIFGLVPAFEISHVSLGASLKEGTRRLTGTRRSRRLQGMLVVSEVALAFVLLVGAGLLVKCFHQLRGLDPGFRSDHLLCVSLSPSWTKYTNGPALAGYYERVIEQLRSVPGVEAIAMGFDLPYAESWRMTRPGEVGGRSFQLHCSFVNPDYFRALGIPVTSGRGLTQGDRGGAPKVVVVNEAFVRRFLSGKQAVGQRIKYGYQDETWKTIVGVVGDTRTEGAIKPPEPRVYVCYLQDRDCTDSMGLALRCRGDPMELAQAVRARILSVDKDQPVTALRSMQECMSEELIPQRVNVWLSGSLGALALALAAVGIYGVLSFLAAQRTHEVGLRMALGAQTRDVLKLVVGQGFRLIVLGLVIGLAAAAGLTRFLSSFLFGVSPIDPCTFACVSVLLGAIALLACYLPARRAARVDPMVALRYE